MATRISKSFNEFDSSMPLQVNYLLEHGVRFLLSSANRTDLRELYSVWTAKFFQFQEPKFRTALRRRELDPTKDTPLVNAQMNTLYASGSFEVRGIQQQAKSNPNLALTDEDYANLYIHEDATTRTPAAEIEIAPILATTAGRHLSNDIITTDPTPGKENSLALPAGVKGIDRFIGITAADDPAPSAQCVSRIKHSRAFTLHHHEHHCQ